MNNMLTTFCLMIAVIALHRILTPAVPVEMKAQEYKEYFKTKIMGMK
jgi:hypothetical protein